MSLQVAHVEIGIGKATGERSPNQRRLAGALTGLVYDWAEGLPGYTGLTFSLWPDTYPALILLSPFKLTKEQAELLARRIGQLMSTDQQTAGSLNVLWCYQRGEVRLLISDGEYRIDSYGCTTSTPNPMEPIPSEVGATRSSTRESLRVKSRLDCEQPPIPTL